MLMRCEDFLPKRGSHFIFHLCGSRALQNQDPLKKIFLKKYGKEPTPENALGYDLGAIIAQTINRIEGPVSKQSIIASFRREPCFSQLSVGQLCFSDKGGHSTIHHRFFQFSANGSRIVE